MGFLIGPAGKIFGGLALIFALMVSGAELVRTHDRRVAAELDAAAAREQLATAQADHARTVAALQDQANAAQKIATTRLSLRKAIDAAPHSACAVPASIRAAVDGLRHVPGARD